ncbi:MAG: energy transducer TonB [Bryobacteraceae bacterium]
MRFRLGAFTLLSLTGLLAQDSMLVKSVEPDYGKEPKPSLILPIMVDFVVLSDGTPFSVSSLEGGFSLPVYRALAQYRFRPAEKPYGFTVTVRIPYDPEKYHPPIRMSTASLPPEIRADSDSLNSDRALEAERKLKENPDSAAKRSSLIVYAASHSDPEMEALRARQISWLIKNQPEAEVLRTPAATISKVVSPSAYAQIKTLWLAVLAKSPRRLRMMEVATNFLRVSEPDEVQRILIPYSRSVAVMAWLGEAYAYAALGISDLGWEGGPPTFAGEVLPPTQLASAARFTLTQEAEYPMLLSAFSTLQLSMGRLAAGQGKLPAKLEEFCTAVRVQIEKTNSKVSGDACKFEPLPKSPEGPPQQTGVSKGHITKQIPPKYPPEAKARGVQGVVLLSVTIGKDGKIRELNVVNGPLLLFEEALRAVKQWEYKPYLLNGEPVEVLTEIEVNFALK